VSVGSGIGGFDLEFPVGLLGVAARHILAKITTADDDGHFDSH